MTATDDETAPRFPVPDVTTYGDADRVTVRLDARGAVLVAYTTDAETGTVTRSSIRLDPAAVAYVRRRLCGL
ncbi:hypothetical protein ACFYN3_40750 [Streptomyces lavendulae]|uniref:hypothetical protein n=1 Tax=Streptomyces lavendulae TaxID=1914 RepID=UPI00369D8AFF